MKNRNEFTFCIFSGDCELAGGIFASSCVVFSGDILLSLPLCADDGGVFFSTRVWVPVIEFLSPADVFEANFGFEVGGDYEFICSGTELIELVISVGLFDRHGVGFFGVACVIFEGDGRSENPLGFWNLLINNLSLRL